MAEADDDRASSPGSAAESPSRPFLLQPGDGLVLVNRSGRVVYLDPSAVQLLGPAGGDLAGTELSHSWPQLEAALRSHDARLAGGPLDQTVAWGSGRIETRLFRSDDGFGVGILNGSLPLEGAEKERFLLLETLLDAVEDSILVTSAEPLNRPGPVILYANPALLQQTGYASHELLGRSPRILQGPDSCEETLRSFRRDLERWQPAEMEVLNYRKDGESYWTHLKASPMADGSGWYRFWVSVQRDVSSRKSTERRLVEQALSDSLTGLPNRRGLLERLQQALARLGRSDARLALIFCDLDHFKDVNDRFGHAVGDELLLEVSRRLKGALRAGDTLARLGGDEFVVLAEDIDDDATVDRLARRLRDCLRQEWSHDGQLFRLSVSMGIALSSDPHVSGSELLRRADLTMYQAKEKGRDRYALYDQGLDARVQTTLDRRQRLLQALQHGDLRLLTQPVVSLSDGSLQGAEALVRLKDGGGGLMAPESFFPLAEQTGLMEPLERWVIQEALQILRNWQQAGVRHGLSINLSPIQLERPTLARELIEAAGALGVELSGLTIEMTETLLLRSHQDILQTLNHLVEAGVTLALDDFGTGHCSLTWLTSLPIQVVKIDRSTVVRIGRDARTATLVSGFLRIFRDLGLRAIAEGIETEPQRQQLLEMGCLLGQGYLFGAPQNSRLLIDTTAAATLR